MKKSVILILLAVTLCFGSKVVAKENVPSNVEQSFGIKYNLTLKCAENYTYNEFWGCVENGAMVQCGDIDIPSPIPPITRIIVTLIKIGAPLVLIIVGMIDIVRAVTASDEKKIKEAQSRFIRRLIPAVLIFFVVTIMQLLIGILADNSSENESLSDCIACMISDETKCIGFTDN